jgi:hypothetical protein
LTDELTTDDELLTELLTVDGFDLTELFTEFELTWLLGLDELVIDELTTDDELTELTWLEGFKLITDDKPTESLTVGDILVGWMRLESTLKINKKHILNLTRKTFIS